MDIISLTVFHNAIPMPVVTQWLCQLDLIMDKYLEDPAFGNEKLAEEIAISQRHLFRRVKQLTGLSPHKYRRRYRLQLAMQYLQNGTYRTVKETADAIGYINTSYFIRQFEGEFGQKPLSVLKEAGWR